MTVKTSKKTAKSYSAIDFYAEMAARRARIEKDVARARRARNRK